MGGFKFKFKLWKMASCITLLFKIAWYTTVPQQLITSQTMVEIAEKSIWISPTRFISGGLELEDYFFTLFVNVVLTEHDANLSYWWRLGTADLSCKTAYQNVSCNILRAYIKENSLQTKQPSRNHAYTTKKEHHCW